MRSVEQTAPLAIARRAEPLERPIVGPQALSKRQNLARQGVALLFRGVPLSFEALTLLFARRDTKTGSVAFIDDAQACLGGNSARSGEQPRDTAWEWAGPSPAWVRSKPLGV